MDTTDNFNFSFSSDLPYPPVCAEERNPLYAREMLDNMAGSTSEISAVSLYFYNNLITYPYDNLPMIFHKISIVEMHHLQIFGNLARELGENPRLWINRGRQKRYWSPGYNNYPTNLKSLLTNAISSENAAINKYEHQICYIKDKNIIENLKRIILDEKLHVSIFEKLYYSYFS